MKESLVYAFRECSAERLDAEVCICAALWMDDGYVIRGHRHDDCIQTMTKIARYKGARATQNMMGFVTSLGRFVDRIVGARLMREAGWFNVETGAHFEGDVLFSEDLY